MAGSLGMPKEGFLQSVRRALGKSRSASGGPEPPYPRLGQSLAELEAQVQDMRQRIADNRAPLLDRLAGTAQLRGWRVWRSPNPEDAVVYIASLARAVGARRVVRSQQEVFHTVPLDEALKNLGLEVLAVTRDETLEISPARLYPGGDGRDFRADLAAADLGITGADYAVAETGSVVLLPRKGLSRLVSVLPPLHIALVQPEEVVDTLDDVFLLRRLEYYRNGGDMGSYLNFITGPSRTADIEQTLVVGVHGPKEVHLVLLG